MKTGLSKLGVIKIILGVCLIIYKLPILCHDHGKIVMANMYMSDG